MTTAKQQQVLDFIVKHVNSEHYIANRCAQIVTTSKWIADKNYGMDSSNRVVKALFEQGLVEYVDGETEYKPRQEAHYLVPRGFQHKTFGCKVGDIWRDGQNIFWQVTGFKSWCAVSKKINSCKYDERNYLTSCPRQCVAMKVTVGEMVAHLVDTL
tara:strand:- start:433 stop:900 length:468 start_codon:yes stop_codon:yes gene_type:complete